MLKWVTVRNEGMARVTYFVVLPGKTSLDLQR